MVSALLGLALLAGPYADTDGDGLLDRWETDGFGPLNPKIHSVSPNRADVIVVFRIRSVMKAETIQPTVDRIAKFFSEMPFKNPDGSTGLHLVPLIIAMPADTDGKGYTELYEQGMPAEWRGLAHGVLVDNSPGGGGQANRADWCGTGYNWMTIVHELGHQFGLPHQPMNGSIGSPFHPSLMNYDYSYQLGGDGNKIQYSSGQFSKMRMKETDLTESVPYPAADLAFLTKRPYYFKVKSVSANSSQVDWNRNGVFGEKHVRADVNDGYSAGYASQVKMGRSAGSPSVVVLDESVAVVYPDLGAPGEKPDYTQASLTPEAPGRLLVQTIAGGKAADPQVLVPAGVCGDPSCIALKGQVLAAYPTADGVSLDTFEGWKRQSSLAVAEKGAEPTLLVGPDGPLLLLTSLDGSVSIGVPGGAMQKLEMRSLVPVGACWDPAKKQLVVVGVQDQSAKKNRIQITRFEAVGWKLAGMEWAEGESGGAASATRPHVLIDPNTGMLDIFVKGAYAKPNQQGLNFLVRQIADKSLSGGWRTKMLGNEWAYTRSPGGVAVHGKEIIYAARGSGYVEDGTILTAMRASGIENAYLEDFDEVGFIHEKGLANSLAHVRREQWKVKWPLIP